jgi:hypothetical protein
VAAILMVAALPHVAAATTLDQPAAGALVDSATPTFTWTPSYPGAYTTLRVAPTTEVSGSAGALAASPLDISTFTSAATTYTPTDPIDAGQAWWQVCQQAPDSSTQCTAAQELRIPIVLETKRRAYTAEDRGLRLSVAGNLWRGSSMVITLRRVGGQAWQRTYRVRSDSSSLTRDITVPVRAGKRIRATGVITCAGVERRVDFGRINLTRDSAT